MSASYHFSTSAFFYLCENDQNAPPFTPITTISIPIESPSDIDTPATIPVRLPGPNPATAAVTIQSAFRGHLVRVLVQQIRAVDSEADRMERQIQRQDTVDAVRRDARERIRVGEGLMALLLRLDAVQGFYPALRELRRRVSRRIVALQEVLDAVVGAPDAAVPEGFPASLEELLAGIGNGEEERAEEDPCRGGGCWESLLGV